MVSTEKWEEANVKLVRALWRRHRKDWNRVMNQEMCDIDGSFLGFVLTYKNLAEIIPLDWTIIDFGCAYAPQAFYFRNHKKYIGVDRGPRERFGFKNTEHLESSIKDYIGKNPYQEKQFAICNFVPAFEEIELVRKNYRDLFVFYPIRDNYPDKIIQENDTSKDDSKV